MRAILFGLALSVLICNAGPAGDEPLYVVATTTIVGDVVSVVGGDHIALTVLLAINADPHAFEPTARDLVAIANADVVFINGATLEADLDPILQNASGPVLSVSAGIALRSLGEDDHDEADPHVWFDPTLVLVWVDNIRESLTELDPVHAQDYQANADVYKAGLYALDTWIEEQVARIPMQQRKLVTDHASLGYFADRYGLEQVAAILPAFSTLAEPSAAALAQLEGTIVDYEIPAIFVGTTINPNLAEQVARDTGTRVVTLYTGSLGELGGPAGTYMALMRYNVTAIVEALGESE